MVTGTTIEPARKLKKLRNRTLNIAILVSGLQLSVDRSFKIITTTLT